MSSSDNKNHAHQYIMQLRAVMHLDWVDVRRSRWLVFCVSIYLLFMLVFVFAGFRESSVLGFTGMGRVLFSLTHSLILLLPLVALMASGAVISGGREAGTLEVLFAQPLSRASYFLGITLVRVSILIIPFLAILLLLTLVGMAAGQPVQPAFVFRCAVVSSGLILAFVAFGMAVSTFVRSTTRGVIYLLLVWLVGVLVNDFALIGLMLKWRVPPEMVFVLASLNPLQSARMGLLSAAESQLSVLGPIGFFLTHKIGAIWLFVLGTVWPLIAGMIVWTLALKNFCKKDLL